MNIRFPLFIIPLTLYLASCAAPSTPPPTKTLTSTPTLSPTLTPTPTSTQTPLPTATPTPQPFYWSVTVHHDKNLDAEMDLEGEIPLSGLTLEARINGESYFAQTNEFGQAIFEFPHDFDQSKVELRFPNYDERLLNGHELTTAVINHGLERVEINNQRFINKTGLVAYTRNNVDIFRAALFFNMPIEYDNIGLSFGEVTYWIPEWDMENSCILNYLDLDMNAGTVLSYNGDTRKSRNRTGPAPPDRKCASQYGIQDQHNGLADTTFLHGSSRVVLSPVQGIVQRVRDEGVRIITRAGNSFSNTHMDGVYAVEEGDKVYPGDVIGISGAIWGNSPRHVHVIYQLALHHKLEDIPNLPYEQILNNKITDIFGDVQPDFKDISLDQITPNYRNGIVPRIDFFWFEPDFVFPDESSPEVDRCIHISDNQGYCIMNYEGVVGIMLHPSLGVAAAGNPQPGSDIENYGLIPAENIPEFQE